MTRNRRPVGVGGDSAADRPRGGDNNQCGPYQRAGHTEQSGQLDLFAGRDQAAAGADDWWSSNAMQAIHAAAAAGVEFQAADLVESYGLGEPDSPKRWGALFGRAARAGVIVPVGIARSKRPSAAGALCRTWRGAP